MKTQVYNQKGEKKESISLNEEIFGVPLNSDLVHQVAVSQMSNKRRNIACTKDRSEVRGGGKKPWRQKGTGRARHGSNRSPIWKGGGVTFGPRKERNFKKKIPSKMKRKAFFMVLSEKLRNDSLIVLDKLEIKDKKTKEMAKILGNLPCKEKKCLIGLRENNKDILLSTNNIPGVSVKEVRNLNVLDLLSKKYLLVTKDAVKKIEEVFSPSKEKVKS